jgi:AcrR family transcriptional regulator
MATSKAAPTEITTAEPAARTDRRARRRQETIDEIVQIAQDVMDERGVNGLSLSEVARRLGVQPPALYKYFDSLAALYDELFKRGHTEHLDRVRDAMSAAEPGLAAVWAGLEASARWAMTSRGVAQLVFWRPVPGFEPSPEAFAPSEEMVKVFRAGFADAVALGELGPGADSDEACWLMSTMLIGVISQAMANEPDLAWGEGRFTPLLSTLFDTFPTIYPPKKSRKKR